MQNKIDKNEKRNISPVTAGLVGAAVTVAAGTAVAVLSKKENRRKVGKAFNALKKKGQQLVKTANTLQDKAQLKLKKIRQ